MEIRVMCIKGWHEGISPDRIVIEVGWDRWFLNLAGYCYLGPLEEKILNAGYTARGH